ncbi:formate dehydrogenase accessory sulfurtransferase FdhD [Geosporobacter ferrireducens]|uniref:Sulfur carrier protein FdhD n=1 Tax=Geosporobacter ferrireducens TaxID=1424294 RepID=A0A1D8GLG9_9FIRM|nr:formate dehydrogenase accessory sulfurtransferase FdhD [Geosporobacter ferrireducens]AOT71754.1 sufurtransferase FdhD [Geosporobacter ferrireducens]MTI55538.1 formate dehydrogenase accessory sulfurtransferase FdhD [Geosporobacter ferrireducens]
MECIKKVELQKYDRGLVETLVDDVIVEYPFTVFVNREELITLLCSPKALDYLAIGFLLSEGLIHHKKDLLHWHLDEEKGRIEIETLRKSLLAKELLGKRTMTTGCGKGTIFYNVVDSFQSKRIHSDLKLSASQLMQQMHQFNKASELFLKTGGVHSACLSDGKDLLLFHEDVGRHNALDKMIGEAFLKDIDLKNKVVITSGRISSEMLIKAAKREIPVVVSRSAPTGLSLALAENLGITVIGFARGGKMNVYTDEERIIFDGKNMEE